VTWSGWESLGGNLTSGPGVSSKGAGLLDVFVLGPDGALYRRSLTAAGWAPWQLLGGRWKDDPAPVYRSAGGVDVFARGLDDCLWRICVS